MSVAEQHEETEFRETKAPHLRVATGGKGPPGGNDIPAENWLEKLEERTVFACRPNQSTVDWEIYFLVHKQDGLYFMKMETPDQKVWDRRVDPKQFCKHYREYKIIAVHPKETPDEGDDNDSGERDPC